MNKSLRRENIFYTQHKRNVPLSIPTALINYKKKRSCLLELGAFYSMMKADIQGDITSIELTKTIVDMDMILKFETAHTTHCHIQMSKDRK